MFIECSALLLPFFLPESAVETNSETCLRGVLDSEEIVQLSFSLFMKLFSQPPRNQNEDFKNDSPLLVYSKSKQPFMFAQFEPGIEPMLS